MLDSTARVTRLRIARGGVRDDHEIAPVRRVRGKYSLRQLVARMPKDYKVKEMDWGRPVGREAW